MSKTCKKRVHGNDKKNLPWDSKKCPGLLHFTLLSTFHFQTHFHYNESYNLIKIETLVFCTFFRISPIIFGIYRRWRKQIILKQLKFNLMVLLSFCLIFQFQLGLLIKKLVFYHFRRYVEAGIVLKENWGDSAYFKFS